MRLRRLRSGSEGVVRFTRGLADLGYSLPSRPWLVVAWKELTEALRDRRTIINAVLLPMILMPIAVGLPMLFLSPKTSPPRIAIVPADPGALPLVERITSEVPGNFTIRTPEFNATDAILRGLVDLVVVIPEGFSANISRGGSARVIYLYDPYQLKSSTAMGLVQGVVDEFSREIVSERLKSLNLSEEFVEPIRAVSYQVTATGAAATAESMFGVMLLPMMVGVLAITGASSFALDMVAGERERRTIEALLTAPVRRTSILAGKYVALTALAAVMGVSTIVSVVLSVGVMAVAVPMEELVSPQAAQAAERAGIGLASLSKIFPQGTSPTVILLGIGAAMLLAALTGNAIVVMGASFAKSFKEAQQYVGAITGIMILPMVAVPYAPARLLGPMRFLPITSVAMLARDLIVNPSDVAALTTSCLASVVYLMAFLVASAKLFGRESVVFD